MTTKKKATRKKATRRPARVDRVVDLDRLTLDPANSCVHDARNLEVIEGSIRELGAGRSILMDADGIIRAGNGTTISAKAAGIKKARVIETDGTELIVVQRTDLTGAKAVAAGLADNRSSDLHTYDAEALKQQIAELDDLELDLGDIGLADHELEELLESLAEDDDEDADDPPPEEPIPPPPKKPKTKPGELIILGNHRLICGDSTHPATFKKVTAGAKVTMILTDPPYGVDYSGQAESMQYGDKKGGTPRQKIEGDADPDAASRILTAALTAAAAEMCFVWCAPQFHDLAKEAIRATAWKVFALIVWNKNHANFGAMGARYKPKFEMAIVGKTKTIPWHGPNNEVTVWDCDRAAKNEFHPTQKPVELFSRAIANHTRTAEVIYDPFLGSGTTLIAAEQLGRTCCGVELDPGYCDVIVTRWETATGLKAERVKK
jgi:site-specific DNA-methyltransferase (adenine-specific)